ncbi:MAG: SMP-30/gluconolactonase/LRE family protein [Coriobacteriales bacterium]|nr:SMP-30/gluconolactonase/LRE family protein [Coriobacteriales bacterium]
MKKVISRRGLLAGMAAAAAVAATGASVASAAEVGDEFAPAAPVTFPADYLVDPDAKWELFATVEGGQNIEGMNFLGDDLYIIDVLTHRVFKIEDGAATTIYEDPEGVSMPNGAKFIDDHTLLITDVRRGIVTFDLETGEYISRATGCNGENFRGPNDLVLDGQGGAYFTDASGSSIINPIGNIYYVKYGDGSFEVEKFASGFAFPNGITLSPDGQFIYVSDFYFNRIDMLPSKAYPGGPEAARVLASFNGGIGPDGMLTDTEGNIIFAHFKAKEIMAVTNFGWTIATVRLPESAGIQVTNLCIHDGYLYACEAEQSVIWRIPIKAQMLEL